MKYIAISFFMMISSMTSYAQNQFKTDTFQTSGGELDITFIGHASLMFNWNGKVIQVDPVMQEADYSKMPAAGLILITHEHGDHFDPKAIRAILRSNTKLLMTRACYNSLDDRSGMDITVMDNGDEYTWEGLKIQAIPAYNMVHKRPDGEFYHPRGRGNGYVLNFGDKRVLVAGDTENIPEIKALKNIDIAFLPMNLPYTMTPEMVADAARAFKPRILYPYHYGKTDTGKLLQLMKGVDGVDVRIRDMQ